MEEELLQILQEVAVGIKTPIIARDRVLVLFGVSNCPAWLGSEDFEFVKMLYKENKLQAVKYLYELAKPHKQNPLSWSKEFLERLFVK